MKYNQIITITLGNGLALLVFASMLASCQKNGIKTSGHFSKFVFSGRFPASESPLNEHFDPKQIFIYCKINSINNEQCFRQHFNEKLNELAKENKINVSSLKEYDFKEYYNKSQIEVATITSKIINSLETNIYSYSKKKEDLCDDNNVVYLKRCLNNSIDADSIHILNTYQQQNPDINGQEYLYLKNQIKTSLENKLYEILLKLQNKQKKDVVQFFDHKYIQFKKKLDHNDEWLNSVTSLPMAMSSCVNEIEKDLITNKKLYRTGLNVKDLIKEYFCIDYVNSNQVMELVNYRYNQNFEKRLTMLFDIIKLKAPEVVQKCVGPSPRSYEKLNNCLESNWEKIVNVSYESWMSDGKNDSFNSEKEIIIKRTKNVAPKLKREIASNFKE